MSIEIVPLAISDIKLIQLKKHADERGYFVETYKGAAYFEGGISNKFVQDNESFSIHRGTIRGLHYQSPPYAQTKLIRVLHGSIFDIVVDMRVGSQSYGSWCKTILSASDATWLYVPAGFAHGFCTMEPNTTVSYKVDAYYANQCEGGVRWNDPRLAIDWPLPEAAIHISQRDRELPLLEDLESPFIFYHD